MPPKYRPKKGKPTLQWDESERIHDGYGDIVAKELRPIDIDEWLNAPKRNGSWKNGRRTRVQAIKRALNYSHEAGLISANPIRGYKLGKSNSRVTYLTDTHEQALIAAADPAFAVALKVCIRTGVRPGCEFAKLTAKHVKDHGDHMEWVFAAGESKTKRLRVIRITDPDVISLVRERITKHASGPIFRNAEGNPWQRQNLTLKFRRLKGRLASEGIELDSDACMYSCRHTYAKRTRQGYWSGRAANIETLARLMGNTQQVCRDHYLQWCDSYSEPLWEAC